MKKNIFEETYLKVQALKKACDEDGKKEARESYNKLMLELSNQGSTIINIWKMYEEAKDCGNEYIDFHEVMGTEKTEAIIRCLRENGIDYFTFSSDWSSAVETAWLFMQNGCSLQGMVEINTKYRDFRTGEYEKAHGYLFKVN